MEDAQGGNQRAFKITFYIDLHSIRHVTQTARANQVFQNSLSLHQQHIPLRLYRLETAARRSGRGPLRRLILDRFW
jgi:hypothetical protein